jgi:hypothetical protein
LEKRSAAFAIANMVGNTAQVYSPYLYDKSSGPQYLPAMIANSVFVLGSIAAATSLLFCLKWENRKLEEAEATIDQQTQTQPQDDDPVKTTSIVESRFEGTVKLNRGFRYML